MTFERIINLPEMINKYQNISSVWMMSLPILILPYSTGVKEMMKLVPSLSLYKDV